MTFHPFKGDRGGEVGPAGRDQGRASRLKRVARGPFAVDLLDSTEAIREDRAAKAEGVE